LKIGNKEIKNRSFAFKNVFFFDLSVNKKFQAKIFMKRVFFINFQEKNNKTLKFQK